MKVKGLLLLAMSLSLVTSPVALAQETGMGFTYRNVLPKNQVKKTTGDYFDLKVKPGQQQALETQLTNETSEELTVQINVNNAGTNSSGEIDYSLSKNKLEAAPVVLSEILTAPNQVTLKPKETQKLKLMLDVPKEKFDGVVLGSVHLKELKKKDNQSEVKSKQVSVENDYAYVYSVRLRETDKLAKQNFEGLSSTSSDNQVYVNFLNDSPNLVKDMSVEILLQPKESEEVISELNVKNYRMAPFSTISIPLSSDVALKPGEKYQTTTKVRVDEQEWDLKSEVTIGEDAVNNQSELFDHRRNSQKKKIPVLLLFILFTMTLLIIYIILIKIRKKDTTKTNK